MSALYGKNDCVVFNCFAHRENKCDGLWKNCTPELIHQDLQDADSASRGDGDSPEVLQL